MRTRAVLCLVQPLLEEHTYDPAAVRGVEDLSDEQNKEVTFAEARAIVTNFPRPEGVRVYWAHGLTQLKDPIGRLPEVYIEGDGLFGVADLDDGVIARAVARGGVTNASMHHERPGAVADQRMLESSICAYAARPRTGVVALGAVRCAEGAEAAAEAGAEAAAGAGAAGAGAAEAEGGGARGAAGAAAGGFHIELEPRPETPCADAMSTETTPMIEPEEPLDTAGFEAFQASVLKWKETGERPADAEAGEPLAKYIMRSIAGHNYMSAESAKFWMTSWAAQMEESEKHVEALAGALTSVMQKNASQVRAEPTAEQRQAAEARVREMAVDVPEALQQGLASCMASLDADAAMAPAPAEPAATEALRLQLAIEEKKLEAARLHEAASRREARTTKKKIDAQQEQYTQLLESAVKRSRYAPPAPVAPAQARAEPPAAADYRYSLAGTRSPWGSLMASDSPYADELRKSAPTHVRSALDMGLEQQIEGFGKRLPREHRVGGFLGGGLPAVICSEDAQLEAKKNPLMNSPLWQALDKSVMVGGVADPSVYLSNPMYRTRQLTAAGSWSLINAVERRGLRRFEPSEWAR